jgi:hypothetical protein
MLASTLCKTESGLRVIDKGYQNTAVISSRITYIDGEAIPLSSIVLPTDTTL